MTDEQLLREHLIERHRGVHVPWFFNDQTGRGWVEAMSLSQLERLHDELVRQGEDCQTRWEAPVKPEPTKRVKWPRAEAGSWALHVQNFPTKKG